MHKLKRRMKNNKQKTIQNYKFCKRKNNQQQQKLKKK